jgi:transcriptional antiterminator RfaH
MKQWHMIYCKPRQEDKAQIHLGRQGYVTYLPRLAETRKRRDKNVDVIEPLFPRYLFIHLDNMTDNWGPIRSTQGVASLVRFGQKAAIVPDHVVQFLQEREDEEGLHHLETPEIERGSPVRIIEGPLQGYEAIFLARSGQERVLILLDILGKQTQVEIDAQRIEACLRE